MFKTLIIENHLNMKTLLEAIQNRYQSSPSDKAKRYVNAFYSKVKKGETINAKVEGNHGTYKVSIRLKNNYLDESCSCYIGKNGCHHTTALAHNYKAAPTTFEEQKVSPRTAVKDLKTLRAYLDDVSLEDLINELKEKKGITQAAFGRGIGVSSQHISVVKKAESRNRHFKELGAIKLACLYVLERRIIKK